MYDVIIAGGGFAGLTAALYTARAGRTVLVIETGTVGGQIAASPLVENYPTINTMSGAELVNRLYEQTAEYDIDFELEEIIKIENGDIKRVYTEDEVYEAKSVIIASGAAPKKLGLENEERLTGNGVSYCAVCDGAFFKNKTAVVVGGGNSAFSEAEFLANICTKVYIVHHSEKFRASKVLIDRVKKLDNIELLTNCSVEKLIGDEKLEAIQLSIGTVLKTDALFPSIGHKPHTAFCSSVVKTDENGYIIAGEDCRTDADGIFAAGDCRTKAVRQLVTAAADGAVSAIAANEYIARKE